MRACITYQRDGLHPLQLRSAQRSLLRLRVAQHERPFQSHEEPVVRVQKGGDFSKALLEAPQSRGQTGRVKVHLQVECQLLRGPASENIRLVSLLFHGAAMERLTGRTSLCFGELCSSTLYPRLWDPREEWRRCRRRISDISRRISLCQTRTGPGIDCSGRRRGAPFKEYVCFQSISGE